MSTWVFLRGLTREHRHWGDFPDVFRNEIPDADIVALDLPGNGDLHLMQSPSSVDTMAAYCRAEMIARGMPPPYHVLAMSLGAMVAVAWARRYPQEFLGCVLISTSLRPFSPFHQRLRPQNYLPMLQQMMPGTSVDARQAAILGMTSNMSSNRAQIIEAWTTIQREHPVSRTNALRQLWAASRYKAPPQKPVDRILLLASEADALVAATCSRKLAHIWQSDFVEHRHAGHDIPLDDGEWVALQVRKWLQLDMPT